ncbi:transmembrane domain protein [Mycobacterium kansasii]|uniref:Transmembrane domain protein n=1 Tax=Mycobacterium kansasii TaxID=1768 RepID=A0A1V3W9K0_MYCKA|nr:transmembrane domain protein [Mycobacterium kansasii]
MQKEIYDSEARLSWVLAGWRVLGRRRSHSAGYFVTFMTGISQRAVPEFSATMCAVDTASC